MVLLVIKFNFLEASCCSVLVVNGGNGFFILFPFLTVLTTKFPCSKSLIIFLASSSFFISIFFPSCCVSLIGNFFLSFFNEQSTVQYSLGINAFISSSLSQISFKAADCTLPALNPHFTFFHKIGLIS